MMYLWSKKFKNSLLICVFHCFNHFINLCHDIYIEKILFLYIFINISLSDLYLMNEPLKLWNLERAHQNWQGSKKSDVKTRKLKTPTVSAIRNGRVTPGTLNDSERKAQFTKWKVSKSIFTSILPQVIPIKATKVMKPPSKVRRYAMKCLCSQR